MTRLNRGLLKNMHISSLISCKRANWFMHEGRAQSGFIRRQGAYVFDDTSSFEVNPGSGRINGWSSRRYFFLARSYVRMQGFRSQHAAGRSHVENLAWRNKPSMSMYGQRLGIRPLSITFIHNPVSSPSCLLLGRFWGACPRVVSPGNLRCLMAPYTIAPNRVGCCVSTPLTRTASDFRYGWCCWRGIGILIGRVGCWDAFF